MDLNNFDHTANDLNLEALRLNAAEQRDSSNQEGDANGDEQFKWTQDMDDQLINNYPNFESLGRKACYEMLSMLLPGTTARMCYSRGKELGLKKVSADEARAKSRMLLSEQATNLNDKKVLFAL